MTRWKAVSKRQNEASQRYRDKHKNDLKHLANRRKTSRESYWRKQGLSVTDRIYWLQYALQEGRCAICRVTPTRRMHVDHNHATKALRGLLCTKCNTGLGLFGDSVTNLNAAITYLQEN